MRRRLAAAVPARLLAGLLVGLLVGLLGFLLAGTGAAGAGATTAAPADAAPAAPVLAPDVPDEPLPGADSLRRALAPLLAAATLGDDVGASVLDPATGAVLHETDAADPRVPASLAKLFTGAAALSVLPPQTRLRTRVVAGGTPEQLVLVGGGDPTLVTRTPAPAPARRFASLADLAGATADAVRAAGRTRAEVVVDDTLFAGPVVAPDWPGGYVPGGVVAPVTALAADHRSVPGKGRPRITADPPLEAGRRFADLLRGEGLTVSGEVRRGRAAPGAPELAAVASPPVAVLVEEALQLSDNDVAEALARHVALAEGRAADFAGVRDVLPAVLARLGVPLEGLRLLDGSGLAHGSQVPPATVARLLALAASPAHPELRPLVSGLPVAGFSGTLAARFTAPELAAGRGAVRAKTGTLTGVGALAGTVRDADGRLLVFAVLADEVPAGAGQERVRAALDQIGSTLAACGCP